MIILAKGIAILLGTVTLLAGIATLRELDTAGGKDSPLPALVGYMAGVFVTAVFTLAVLVLTAG